MSKQSTGGGWGTVTDGRPAAVALPPGNAHVTFRTGGDGRLHDDLLTLRRAMEEIGTDQRRLAERAIAWVALMLRKNRDYGSSAWEAPLFAPNLPPRTAILVRMGDKAKRLRRLAASAEVNVKGETFDDTMGDLGAYALLYLTCPQEGGEERGEEEAQKAADRRVQSPQPLPSTA